MLITCFRGHMGIVSGRDNVCRNFEVIIKRVFPYL